MFHAIKGCMHNSEDLVSCWASAMAGLTFHPGMDMPTCHSRFESGPGHAGQVARRMLKPSRRRRCPHGWRRPHTPATSQELFLSALSSAAYAVLAAAPAASAALRVCSAYLVAAKPTPTKRPATSTCVADSGVANAGKQCRGLRGHAAPGRGHASDALQANKHQGQSHITPNRTDRGGKACVVLL